MSEEQQDQGRQQGLDESFAGVAGMRPVQGDLKKSFDGAANLKPAVVSPAAQAPTPSVAPAEQPIAVGSAAPAPPGDNADE